MSDFPVTCLSVNLNKVALIRNSRGRDYPSVERFARLALDRGAAGVTIHPRPDQRHATYADVATLRRVVEDYPHAELNIEGYPGAEFLDAVLTARPHQCTLVPDAPDQLTSDHGWDLGASEALLRPVVDRLNRAGVRVSVFVDPEARGLEVAARLGVARVELYTEAYALAFGGPEQTSTLARYRDAARAASDHGLGVNAGHDLNLQNLAAFLTIPGIVEVSIGHALTVEALEMGFAAAVEAYTALIHGRGRAS